MSGQGRPIGRGRGVNTRNVGGNSDIQSRGPSNGAGINIDNRGGRAPGYNAGNGGGNPWNKNIQTVPVNSNNQQSVPRNGGSASTDPGQTENAPRPEPVPKQGQGDNQKRERHLPTNEMNTKPKEFSTKQGSSGRVVKLKANYFALKSKSEWGLYQYRVDMTVPEEEQTRTKKQLMYQQRKHLGAYLFDGTVLYTINRLEQPFEKVSYRDEKLEQPVNISIRLVGDVMLGDYHYFQVYGILIRKSFEHLKLRLIGRNFFDGEAKIQVPDYYLEILPGYVTSIRQHDGGVLMSAEISHKVMRTLTVYDVLDECYRRDSRNFKKTFENKIIGNVVITQYNNKTYRIDDIDFDIKPNNSFERSGVPITYAQYYLERYKINIKNLSQPMLVHRATSKEKRAGMPELLYLVPELCYVTGLTDEMRLDFKLMQEVSNYTRVAPAGRIKKLLAFNQRLTDTPQIVKDFEDWNLKIDDKLVELQGRQLNPEVIKYGSAEKPTNDEADFTRELQSARALQSGHLKDWFVVAPRFMMKDAQNFVGTIMQVAKQQGFQIEKPKFVETNDDRDLSFANVLSDITDKCNPQLIAICISKNQLSTYKTIKKKLCCDRSIPSQVMCKRSIANPKANMQKSIATKIAIQLNCKTGGIPWSVSLDPSLGGLMIVGYDACHDPKARDKSIGAMVASLDQKFGKYFSSVTKHQSGEELSSNLGVQLIAALKEFYILNRNRLPTRIIIYRDGVGEGQIPFVKEHEVCEVRKKLEEYYERFGGGANKCRIGFIIVTKRINTRFFTMNDNNPKPGTVVDNTVTDPLKYDFFLVSQSVRQGTVAPTAYNIIDDNTGLTPNAMQVLSYKFCQMYFNFSGTVKVPAPCQYAHKLALLVSQGLDGNIPSKNLSNSFYFL